MRICSGHFHGGEKKEGDIPVADPSIDPPRRIELPLKTSRLHNTSVGAASQGQVVGIFTGTLATAAPSHRHIGGHITSTYSVFRPSVASSTTMRLRNWLPPKTLSLPPPTLPLMSSQTHSLIASTLTTLPSIIEGQWSDSMPIWSFPFIGTPHNKSFSYNNLRSNVHPLGFQCEFTCLLSNRCLFLT